MKEPAKKLPSRSDVMDTMSTSVQRLSMLWDYAASRPRRGDAAKWDTVRRLADIIDELDPILEDLTDSQILEVWARHDDPPEKADLEGICMELATVLRQAGCILSILMGRPPRVKRGSP